MIIRELTAEEVLGLEGHPGLGGFLPPDPDTSKVIAAIDELGEIHAFWCLIQVVHAEPIWISPELRGTTLVGRLWKAVRETLATCGIPIGFCFAADEIVANYLSRLGLQELAFRTFLFETSCPTLSSPPGSLADSVSSEAV
jgi:hypothetical protein